MLPAKRKATKSTILKGPKREWPRHRAWVRKHLCCVPGCEQGPIEFAHVRDALHAGTGLKPPDWMGISLCSAHHREQHNTGVETFQKKYSLNCWKLAAEFAEKSTDLKMKEAMGVVR
jgi:hypothetical protein